MINAYFKDENTVLYLADSLKLLKRFRAESVDVIFADPPYFLSNGGMTCKGGKAVSVNKGDWDKAATLEDKHKFNRRWISLCRNILKPNGTIWISGTLHNIYSVGMALEQEGFKIMNNITWQKTNPPPNLSCRYLTHSTETILWAKKKRRRQTFFQLRAHEGTKRRQADEGRLVGYLDGNAYSAARKTFRQAPDAKAAVPAGKNNPSFDAGRRFSLRPLLRLRHNRRRLQKVGA